MRTAHKAESIARMTICLLTAGLLLSLWPSVSAGQMACSDVRDCQQKAQQLHRKAQELRTQRLELERQYRIRTQQLQKPPAPREECFNTPQGRVCRRAAPMIVDDRPRLQEQINQLAQSEQAADRQASQYEAQGQRLGQPPAQPLPTARSGGPGASCFIATAAYGTPAAEEVVVLREFRDKHLLSSSAGRRFVDVYYTYSPAIAAYIAKREALKAMVRMGLGPVAYAVKHPLDAWVNLVLSVAFVWGMIHWIRIRKVKGKRFFRAAGGRYRVD